MPDVHDLFCLLSPNKKDLATMGDPRYLKVYLMSMMCSVAVLEATNVGSTQVPFLMCTIEIPQKLQHKFLLLTFGYLLLVSLFSNYELFMYFCFCFFFHLYGSFNRTTSTSLSFSEFPELFLSILLLSQLIESHCALSSARCHF